VERARGEVWGVVDFALSDMRCLARDCADDKIARKFVAPALELIMLDKARGAGSIGGRPCCASARCTPRR